MKLKKKILKESQRRRALDARVNLSTANLALIKLNLAIIAYIIAIFDLIRARFGLAALTTFS